MDVLAPLKDICQSNELSGLSDIFEPDCQLSVWKRPPITAIQHYLDTVELAQSGLRLVLQAGEAFPAHRLPAAAGRDVLLADIDLLATLYIDLLGCPRIGIRLEVLHKAMCPRFHIDRTGIRLLCTYRGPGTEYLAEHAANRSWLGVTDAPTDAILQHKDGRDIQQIPPFALALLKGNGWQGNQPYGLIHRSPACSHTRVLLAIDAIWE